MIRDCKKGEIDRAVISTIVLLHFVENMKKRIHSANFNDILVHVAVGAATRNNNLAFIFSK